MQPLVFQRNKTQYNVRSLNSLDLRYKNIIYTISYIMSEYKCMFSRQKSFTLEQSRKTKENKHSNLLEDFLMEKGKYLSNKNTLLFQNIFEFL